MKAHDSVMAMPCQRSKLSIVGGLSGPSWHSLPTPSAGLCRRSSVAVGPRQMGVCSYQHSHAAYPLSRVTVYTSFSRLLRYPFGRSIVRRVHRGLYAAVIVIVGLGLRIGLGVLHHGIGSVMALPCYILRHESPGQHSVQHHGRE